MRGQHRYENESRYEDRERDSDRRQVQQRGSEMTPQQERSGGGDWYGYVQPYRYYGPGYRGVGYYSVLYQGREPYTSDEGEMTGDEQRSDRWFDQRGVHYGQGQDAGAASEEPMGRSRSGSWGDRARQWGQFGGQLSGAFAGRGPKGYTRSDERIREDVSDKLMEHPDLDASEIEVRVSGGEVTLAGSVDSRWAKRLAEDIAESCTGVRDVMNQLRVPSDFESRRATRESSAETSSQPRNGRRPVASKR
jgi:osmotically-inducible protein OsmY